MPDDRAFRPVFDAFVAQMHAKSPSRTRFGKHIDSVLESMANAGRISPDVALDVCRHGRGPSQFCPMCDRAEVAFEPAPGWPGTVDLRDEPGVDVREHSPKKMHPHR